jgi:hypothetical protein
MHTIQAVFFNSSYKIFMKNISSKELRELRNKFRESKQHKYIPEASLIAS